jgi:thioredoxin 1
MKKLIGIATLTIAAVAFYSFTAEKNNSENAVVATTTGIQFKELSFEQAKAEAKKTGKLIFMDAYASWCGPCKMMDRNTFSDESVGKFFNEKFINLKVDMEKSADGPTLSRLYSVTAYPTFLWIDGDGKVVKREMGYRTPEQFLALVKDLK